MKRKLFLTSAVSVLLASGAMGQVVNFHDAANGQLSFPGVGYEELFAGQGAYSDPGNDIWNGFGQYAGYQSTYFYSGGVGGNAPWPQQSANPGNPYANYGGTISTGSSLFAFSGSPAISGNSTSSGQWTPITLKVSSYVEDAGIGNIGAFFVPNGSASFLLGEEAVANGTKSNVVFTLQNVPAGTYGLYLYGANEQNDRGTAFSVNTGTAHNGIAATLNSQIGSPAPAFVEGQNLVIFENVTPDGSGNITITASPNAQDGVGNSNLTGEADVNGFQLIFNPPPTALGSTAAQNLYAGGTANFSFTPAFAASPTFQWQSIIGGVTANLSDNVNISGSKTTNLTITGVDSLNVGLYQCVISTATATNTTPAAPLTLLTSTAAAQLQNGDITSVVGYVLRPGDVLSDFNNSVSAPYNSIPPPFDMTVTKVEDNTLEQYVNFGGNGSSAPFSGPVGFTVTPELGATVVTGLRFFTSSSHPEDDPADYLLQGSNDGGTNVTTIAGGLLDLPAQRNAAGGAINDANQVLQEIVFANSVAYTTYQLTFTNVDNDSTASNGVQIAEVQLLGSLPANGPGITQPPDATETLLVGTTFHPTIIPYGPGPLTYQWSFNSQTIADATNATFTLANVQTTNGGSYNVIVHNPYGSTNATTVLTVVPPTAYQQALLAFNPLGYWPLNESSGPVAYDVVNGYNGTYTGTGFDFQQAGVPFTGFGSSSYSAAFGNSSYVDVPEGPFNITTPITIMAWVQIQSGLTSFLDILGHGDSSYRITVNNGSGVPDPGFNDGGANSGDATSSNPLSFGVWHFVAGVYEGGSGTTHNGFLYVDGLATASNEITSVAGNALDVSIGGAPDYTTRDFIGDICHAAIIPQALTAAQIQAIYDGAAPSPSVTVPSNPITVDENGNGSISISVLGALPFTYQWYYSVGATTDLIPGATNSTLQLTDVQLSQSSDNYFVVVSNAFGAYTSATVNLNILSGPPTVVTDITPLLQGVPTGVPISFSVTASGTEPFTYQWSNGVTAISGATNSSYTFNVLPGSNNYTVGIGNSQGITPSSTATVVGITNSPPVLTFNDNGTNWTLNDGAGDAPTLATNVLELTDGVGGQATSAFYNYPQYIGGFLASYTYQAGGNKAADGVTFCIQNAPDTTNAVGGGGGDLGFAGITNSAAFEMNIYAGDHGGPGVTFGTDGNVPNTDPALGDFLSTAPVAIASGEPINVQIYYSQNVMTVWLTENTTNTYKTSFAANLPDIVTGSTAYVGFTGACGGDNAIQTVSNFTFSYSLPATLSVTHGAAGSIVISWPIAVASAFHLQQSTTVKGPWADVVTAPQDVDLENQVTLTPGTSPWFYRLSLQ